MISAVKVPKDMDQWHPWFAWHPVTVTVGHSGMYVWVWLHWIERKSVPGYHGSSATYRLKARRWHPRVR